ncbi:MAG TPA: KilA-N domain-containing protein [Nostocaceae cyanobacterium]|nr:KilA-N domain-containing protein [Nostocaceae cyanobacterium]
MNLITHEWNGSQIAQLSEPTTIAKFEIPASYVNATQMCKACGKQFNDYARLDSTKAYWEGLSLDTGIPVSNLAIAIRGRGDKVEQGTWVHPEIAIDLAQWVSVEFRIWANRTLKRVVSGEIVPQPQPEPTTPTPQQISELYDLVLGKTDLDPKLIAGVKLNAIAKLHPALAPAAELAKPVLEIATEEELLSPTRLAEILSERTGEDWSNQRVNKLLVDQGFQEKNTQSNSPSYLPTDKGKEYSQLIINTAKGRDKTVQSLRWFPKILEVLDYEQ